jgi:hypothetical protein
MNHAEKSQQWDLVIFLGCNRYYLLFPDRSIIRFVDWVSPKTQISFMEYMKDRRFKSRTIMDVTEGAHFAENNDDTVMNIRIARQIGMNFDSRLGTRGSIILTINERKTVGPRKRLLSETRL